MEKTKILVWNDFSLKEETGKELLNIKYTTLNTYLKNNYQMLVESEGKRMLLEIKDNQLYVNSSTFIKDIKEFLTSLTGYWYLFSKQ